MKPSRSPRYRDRGIRLLVFACFFNFSGLNNGYTHLTAVAPINANQSVCVMGTLVKSFAFVLAPKMMVASLSRGHRYMKSSKSRRVARQVRVARGTAQAIAVSHESIAPAANSRLAPGMISPVREDYLKEKESWRKQKEEWSKENWNRLYVRPWQSLPEKDFDALESAKAALAKEPVWDEGLRLKKVLRHIVYPDGGDSNTLVNIALTRQIPGPVLDRGLFLRGGAQA